MDDIALRNVVPNAHQVPYATPESLPAAVRADLPPQDRRLDFDAFTSAWQRFADFADREPFWHRVARSAVRRHKHSPRHLPAAQR